MSRLAAALAVVLLLSGAASAAPIGHVDPRPHRWSIGGEIGYAFDRDFRPSVGARDVAQFDQRDLYLIRLTYGFADDWEAFGRFGTGSLEYADVPDAVSNLTDLYDMGTEWAWGGGVRGVVMRDGPIPSWDVALEAQYLTHTGHDGEVTEGPNVGADARNWDVWEWSIAVLLQSRYDRFRPYVGAVFGDAEVEMGSIAQVPVVSDDEADEHAGIVFGTGYDFGGDWTGYVEGRAADEYSVNFGLLWAL